MDQFILTLIFRFGIILCKKLDVKYWTLRVAINIE